ncbi:hypothetical protein B835_2060 [Enterococcus mundtii 3F]|uniref:hypothetical protein n=1 Tax=Enterococcus mundtii TaxID=53346 RepID=UPI0023021A93|nr:hypothetical protein [Enterococcus mundtii]MDA9462131.1 hypothetical protein [Enterococcus mundtii 3F]
MRVKGKSTQTTKSLFRMGKPEDRSILDLFPYKSCSDQGILLTKENRYQRFYRVISTDVEGLNEQEKVERMDQLTIIMRTFVKNIKLISLTTETDLSEQITQKRQLLNKNRLEQMQNKQLRQLRKYEKKIVEEIEELKRAELERPDLSFFFVIEAKDIKELSNQNRQLLRASGVLGLKPLPKKELIKILYRMNNMNDE